MFPATNAGAAPDDLSVPGTGTITENFRRDPHGTVAQSRVDWCALLEPS
jgi:hypothetical protein